MREWQHAAADEDTEEADARCEPITVHVCQDLPYNKTILPNYFNHQSQDEALQHIYTFMHLIQVNLNLV
jgi:hypothetical protein